MNRLYPDLPLIYALVLTFASCGDKIHQNSGAMWGTTYHITYSSPIDLGDSIVSVMADIERQLSVFSPSSTVSRINRNEDVEVEQDFINVFNLSRRISGISGGAFDPTVGPLTDIWGFGPSHSDDDSMPTTSQIDSILVSVGISDCSLDGRRVVKKSPDTRFDFSSVAKGYGVDAIAAMLSRNGCTDYLVEIGGEVVARGLNPTGKTWRVQIDSPASDRAGHISMLVIPLDNSAVATSGNYRNYRISEGRRIGHTLDPRTGMPALTSVLSATVIAPDCATADAIATACMVIDVADALSLIDSLPGVEALFAISSADSIKTVHSRGFPAL